MSPEELATTVEDLVLQMAVLRARVTDLEMTLFDEFDYEPVERRPMENVEVKDSYL